MGSDQSATSYTPKEERLENSKKLNMENSWVRLILMAVILVCYSVPGLVSGDTERETPLEVAGLDPARNSTAGQESDEGLNFVYQELLHLVDGVLQKLF